MKYRTVQTMMLPDCAEENYGLYYQGTGGIQVQQGEKKSLSVPENEKADLFTYFNGFYPKQWSQYAQLDGLRIKVTVSGNCRVLLCHIDGSRTVVDEEKESRTAADIKNELVFEVSDVIENIAAFWICIEGLAQGGVLYDVDFQSAVEVQQAVRPAVVICTCRREKEVISNLERISRMDLEERPGIFLIDNGNTLTEEMVPDWVHLVPNRNCGGAGGFTRGMIEALKDPGFTHVILMDDDIVLNPEVLTKTMLFLSSVKKEWQDAPLGGSLIERDIPWKQFECGAFWNRGRIQGCGQNMDLRVVNAFNDLNEIFMKCMEMILKLSPIGVFCLLCPVIAANGPTIIGSLAMVLLAAYICYIVHMLVVYSLIVKTMGGLSPAKFLKGMLPAIMFAFSSASSVGTLPINLECTEKLGAKREVASFVLPLGATINMDGTAIYQGVCAIFIASCYGISLTLPQMLTIVLTATLASIGTAGVPGAGMIMLAMVLTSVGLPVDGIALVAGVDRIFDMGRTTVNITGDAACTIVVSNMESRREARKGAKQ